MRSLFALTFLLAAPLHAGVPEAIEGHILPRHAAFAEAATALDTSAQADCTAEALKPAYNGAFDGWIGIQHLALGPLQEIGGPLALQFWPDAKGFTARQLSMLTGAADPSTTTPDGFAAQSVAVQGFMALERMLYDEAFSDYAAGSYSCALVQAIAHDIASKAGALNEGWPAAAQALRTAGEAGNATYLAPSEAAQALFTALIAGIEYNDDARLARPLGSFERPRPTRAEAWRSDRSQRNLALSLAALEEFARLLADGHASESQALFDDAEAWLADLDEPRFEGVAEPTARMGIESLTSYLGLLKETAAAEVGDHLNVGQGFNALDGD
ncbi:imelysin family protein [Oceanicola sp. 502str15]|uniref:imelysin family protein n=1 Tax=Oceanicola sp. 502str15 TaxID=2696061 RepID=UPI0020945164|nr:imelysin family protein [Oceanicola sp. 502str15]MCO6381185.1 signal peptidase [Oceanicola sp. 502str15]